MYVCVGILAVHIISIMYINTYIRTQNANTMRCVSLLAAMYAPQHLSNESPEVQRGAVVSLDEKNKRQAGSCNPMRSAVVDHAMPCHETFVLIYLGVGVRKIASSMKKLTLTSKGSRRITKLISACTQNIRKITV